MPAPGPALVLKQSIQPANYSGTCPVSLRLVAVIEKGAWGTVEYHWMRSDGTRSAREVVDFRLHEAPKTVVSSWRAAPRDGEVVWASVVITEPANSLVTAPRASARVVCTSPGAVEDPCGKIEEVGPIGSLVRQCAQTNHEVAEREMARVIEQFGATLESADQVGSGGEGEADSAVRRKTAFTESQQAWEIYKVSACDEVYLETWPGSMAETARIECLREFTEVRTEYIRRRLDGDDHQ